MEPSSAPVRKHEYQLASETSRSQQEFKNSQTNHVPSDSQLSLPQQDHQKRPKVITASAGLASLVGVLYLIYHHYINVTLNPSSLENTQYKFQIYCPVNKIKQTSNPTISHQFNNFQNASSDLRFLTQQLAPNVTNSSIDQYIIYIQMRRISPQSNISKLFFCSYVTDWDTPNCSYPTPICTVPGAILYAQRNKPIEVAWVYDINNDEGDKQFGISYTPCMNYTTYNQTYYKKYCTLAQKKPGYEACTYESPTDIVNHNSTYTNTFHMSPSNIPVVTHIHGLVVRPTLDGNPMAWMGKGGQIGTAFQSLLNGSKYFNNKLFKHDYTTTLLPMPNMNKTYVKVNRYENTQLPGNLWYHDHSMHITQDNVGHGLLGDYIIYDPAVEAQMPSRQYDIFIVAGQHITNSSFEEVDKKVYQELRINPRVPFFTQGGIALMRNQTYRMRLLNGMFDAVFSNLRFKTQCQIVAGQPINPATCRKTLKFTVIGSDSAMFNTPVHNVTNLTISSAQRFEFLIIFDGNINNLWQNPISAHSNKILLVDNDNDIKHSFVLLPKTSIPNNYNKLPSQLTIINGVEFYDLKPINQLCANVVVDNPTKCIKMMRMKPIFKKNGVHFFNGHYDYAKSGQTDNPQIGTTQDWVFISVTHRHPIHIHLINYQIIGLTTLKNYTVSIGPNNFQCSFYQMDYWVAAGVIFPSDNLTQLCIDSLNVNILDQTTQSILNQAFPENKPNPNNASVTGFDVFQLIKTPEDQTRYNTNTNCVNQYKYICGPPSNKNIPEQYRRWKEVALVTNRTVMVLRIRWTSTDYLVNGKGNYPYFPVPEDQLIEYPGYVYHCHFLQHEDNKLMRPFQMQPSDLFGQHFNMSGTPMGDCMIRKGFTPWAGWQARYKCINQLSSCPDTT